MASQSANIHPTKEWKSINMVFRGDGVGRCVKLEVLDTENNWFKVCIHYGWGDPAQLAKMIQDAAAALTIETPEEESDGTK